MENNKKLPQQNFARFATPKVCAPIDTSNRKVPELQTTNKNSARNSRRRENSNTQRISNDFLRFNQKLQQPQNQQQQQQQQQHQFAAKARNAEKRARNRAATYDNEGDCNSAASEGAYCGSGSVHNNTDGTDDNIGGNSNINTGHIESAAGLHAAHSAGDQSAASTGLGQACQAAGKPKRGSAAFKKNTPITTELNSVLSGRKKQNYNHLLNFQYAALDVFSGHNSGAAHSIAQRYNNYNSKKYGKYNKEQFLQANFQFVIALKAKPNFTTSPDTLVAWDTIEQINIQTTEEPRCPICLYPPVAAKLTRCGHAYCWPCILHYLALSDKTWRKCPICYEAVHIADLKSTAIMQQQSLKMGDTITLQLMHRKKGSLFIEKYEGAASGLEHFPYLSDEQSEQKRFSKFLLARNRDVLDIIEREQRELSSGMDDPECTEFIFVQQALDLLQKRRESLPSTTKNELEAPSKKAENNDTEHNEAISENAAANSNKYYFYQSIDGQNIYLHPLNIKMLQMCYGSLDCAPPLIDGRILQMEYYSMDEHVRRVFSCLGHLPLTRQFAVVEIDLKPPFITETVLETFCDDILTRKKERQRRECEEVKREKKINEFNDRQMGKLIASTANLNIGSSYEFPICGFETTLIDETDAAVAAATPTRAQHVTSYSAALADSVKPNNRQLWPELNNSSFGAAAAARDSNHIKKFGNWTNTVTVANTAQRQTAAEDLSDNDVDAEEKLCPTTRTTLSDVLAEAMLQRKATDAGKTNANGKKNKKAKKMQPLFSTGMNYGGN